MGTLDASSRNLGITSAANSRILASTSSWATVSQALTKKLIPVIPIDSQRWMTETSRSGSPTPIPTGTPCGSPGPERSLAPPGARLPSDW